MRFLGHVTDRRGAAMWEGAGAGKTEILASHITPAWLLPPLLQLASPGLLDLCVENWSRKCKLSNFYLPGCMLLTLAVPSATNATNLPCKIELKTELLSKLRGGECLCPLCSSWRPRDHLQHAPNGVWSLEDLEEIYVYPSSHARWPSESKVSYKAKKFTARL